MARDGGSVARIGLIIAVIFAGLGAVLTSNANSKDKKTEIKRQQSAFMKTYGATSAPIGHVKFCKMIPAKCLNNTMSSGPVTNVVPLTDAKWDQVNRINTAINKKIKRKSDQELYGITEHWTYPRVAGDSEDIALQKKNDLEALGFPAAALKITVVLREQEFGHAVLTLRTTQGDYILDSYGNTISLWHELNYTFLKWQSDSSPMDWVALQETSSEKEPLTTGGETSGTPGLFVVQYGETLPPVGYVKFCHANPNECKDYSSAQRKQPDRLKMTPKLWKKIRTVNRKVNAKIRPVEDQALYGEIDRWTYPVAAGDCEDYVLLKKRELEALGFPAKSLSIATVVYGDNKGHAVLTLRTTEGDYALDNRRNDILLWGDTGYTYLKHQSPEDPNIWQALVESQSIAYKLGRANSEADELHTN
jgi:predicted transglutaminase-like cysteine proteinase